MKNFNSPKNKLYFLKYNQTKYNKLFLSFDFEAKYDLDRFCEIRIQHLYIIFLYYDIL